MQTKNIKELTIELRKLISQTEGSFAVAFKDLSSEADSIFINADEVFHAASTIKTPVMIEVFRQAWQGVFSLDDLIPIKNKFKSIVDGSAYSLDILSDGGEELYLYIGKTRTIRQLVYDMITVSSNLAANILIELVKAENIMVTMNNLGAHDLKILRCVEDVKAFREGFNNIVTAFDLLIIYEKLALAQVVSKEACKEMIDILLEQKHNYIIPAKLPTDVKAAHKTGSIPGVEHDSGIVYLPDGHAYLLVLLSKDISDNTAGIKTEAEISRLIYDYMIRKIN